MKNIPDGAVQAAVDATLGTISPLMLEIAIIAAYNHFQPVDVAAVRKQAFEEAAVSIECGCENPHCELDEAAEKIRALSAEPALKGQQHDK